MSTTSGRSFFKTVVVLFFVFTLSNTQLLGQTASKTPVEGLHNEQINVVEIRRVMTNAYLSRKISSFHFFEVSDKNILRVPLVENQYVTNMVDFYGRDVQRTMNIWLKRSEKYFPMMRDIFKQVGVPVELIHLSLVESGLNANAISSAQAVGMWQFIRSTGQSYGLEVNWWIDERRDPVKATRAAARYLKDLYKQWGNWHLAIAGYNISPIGLISAVRDGGGALNYWSARPYLPNETQEFVPRYIAVTKIARQPRRFGFQKNYHVEPYKYELVEVAPLMPLDLLAETAGISTEKLKAMNPELLRGATPPGSPYEIKLPPKVVDTFLANYSKIPEDARSQHIVMHEVDQGETLSEIADQYGVTVHVLYATNKGLSSLIHPGQRIVIPLPGTGGTMEAPANNSASGGTAKVYYTVKSGDTIGEIAGWYDVRSEEVRDWNNTSNLINVGEELVVYVPAGSRDYYQTITHLSLADKQRIEARQQHGEQMTMIEYQVQSNDTLIEIAQSFNVSVSSIKQMNSLRGSTIYEGQMLKINMIN